MCCKDKKYSQYNIASDKYQTLDDAPKTSALQIIQASCVHQFFVVIELQGTFLTRFTITASITTIEP